ncbi:hypothetical protein B0T22DRAFT_299575 [Podospora appendiculata]|uniref:Uncharacterized protein n=1 Tax=Podospora appendiculata TaxID=314037 RepID=A0AAE0X0A5_9PEZI|nr:hypothetical protein B0T22DRAFT_299575 [Podospora appendiculata]
MSLLRPSAKYPRYRVMMVAGTFTSRPERPRTRDWSQCTFGWFRLWLQLQCAIVYLSFRLSSISILLDRCSFCCNCLPSTASSFFPGTSTVGPAVSGSSKTRSRAAVCGSQPGSPPAGFARRSRITCLVPSGLRHWIPPSRSTASENPHPDFCRWAG